jgi:DNA-directed RNA polymerase specialized sigma24 family protein
LDELFGNRPKKHKEILSKVIYGQMDYSQACRMMNIPYEDVKSFNEKCKASVKSKFGYKYNYLIK